ncbi:S8 family serine peptidase [Streptomyces sp. NPDC086787]|uniref:S8 family serine peptidase n=1 Tax=Streptomyces sp. NPDC086787 TaxID=3365759 RepID=UPI00380636EF
MRPPARTAARLLSGAGLAAALLLPGAAPVQAATFSGVPTADGKKGRELPGMASTLGQNGGKTACTSASHEHAEKPDWSRERLDLDRLHGYSTGAGVTVALIGTGVASDATGLTSRVTARGDAGDDCVGYGTFLAGLIAGTGGDTPGLAGVAPGAKILALRGTDKYGVADARLVADALREATEARAGVIAIAVALPSRDAKLTRAVADARAGGAVVIAAAAPDPVRTTTGEVPPRTYWPAGEPGVLSVADMLPSGERPDGSLPTDGIDLVAPGTGVVSIGPRGNGHYLGSGAAVATAYAAGAAAAVRSAHPDDSAAGVVRSLTATAYPASIPQLDPYAAVTTVLGEAGRRTDPDHGSTAVKLRDTSAADHAADRATLFVLLGSAGLLTVLWGVFVLPRARARRWRPAGPGTLGGAEQE